MRAEYDIMRPPAAKQADVAVFISNCAARSFRLPALEALSRQVAVHSFGQCLRSNHTWERKGDVLRRYRFTLAFENSQVRVATRLSCMCCTGCMALHAWVAPISGPSPLQLQTPCGCIHKRSARLW